MYHCYFSQKKINHIGDLFQNDGKMRSWEYLRGKLGLDDNQKFYWRQIIHAIAHVWKEMFSGCVNNINDLIFNEHHLIRKHQIYCLEKLKRRELYNMQLILNIEKPTAETYFEKKN